MKITRADFFQKLIQFLGSLITIIALVFALQRIWTLGQANWNKLLEIRVILLILIGGLFYGLNEFLLALAWQKLLVWFGESPTFGQCNAIYGRTQIAKYIPGNVFHLPTRHLAGSQAGFKHPALVGAAIYEIIGLVVASGTITMLGLPAKTNLFSNTFTGQFFIIFFFILLIPALQFMITRVKLSDKLGFPNHSLRESLNHLFPIWIIYLLFFTLAGAILWTLVGITTSHWDNIPPQFILSAYAISWLAGFITPGAPAGIGVREVALIVLLSNYIGEPASILVAIAARFVVSIGDISYFVISHLYKNKQFPQP